MYVKGLHSKEISKQYIESVKTVKQVDSINQHQWGSNSKGRGHGNAVEAIRQSWNRSQSKGRPKGSCTNCGSSHPPKRCKAFGKECYHCHKKAIFPSIADPSNVAIPHPSQNITIIITDNHTLIHITLTKYNSMMPCNLNKTP